MSSITNSIIEGLSNSLSKPEVFTQLRDFVYYLVDQDDLGVAYQVQKNLAAALVKRTDLINSNPGLYRGYNECLFRLQFVALPFLQNSEVVNFFNNGIVVALNISEVDLLDKLEAKIVRIIIHGDRDKFKQELREALLKNNGILFESIIGEKKLLTVSDWLKNYSNTVGFGEVDVLKREQYFTSNQFLKGLILDKRDKLRKLFNIFDYLKKSSLTPEGSDDVMTFNEGDKTLVFNRGEVYEIDKNNNPILDRIFSLAKESILINSTQTKIVNNIFPPVPVRPIVVNQKSQIQTKTLIPLVPVSTTPQVLKTTEPVFFFNLEDEREVDKLRIPNTELRITNTLEEKLRVLAEEVIKKHNFSFKDEVGKRRFINLFVSHLKDVRNVVEVRETLLKPITSGGLGLPVDKTEQVIKIIEDAKSEFESRIKNHESTQVADIKPQTEQQKMQSELDKLMREDMPVAINPAIKPVGPQVVLPKSDKIGELNPKSEILNPKEVQNKNESSTFTPLVSGVVAQATKTEEKPLSEDKFKNWREEMLKEIAKAVPPPPSLATGQSPIVPNVSPVVRNQESGINNDIRPQLTDIKAPPRTLGPLEELKSLNLVDFRRLDSSPVEALNKVRAKIDLIGETSVSRRVEAVRSWQASPVYQLYLKLGRASIEQEKSIVEIVASLQGRGEPTLSEAEFNAIIDFNQKIRF